jgi:hypothetical protein
MTNATSTVDATRLLPTAEDAQGHREWIAELHRQMCAAQDTADRLQAIGDAWHKERPLLPEVAESSEDLFDSDALACPAGNIAGDRLCSTLREAARQAYLIAGHYRRAAHSLHRDLHTEIDAHTEATATFAVLALDELGRLGYVKPSDEWFADGQPLGQLGQDAANELQQAGLLPAYDEFFPQTAKASAEVDRG